MKKTEKKTNFPLRIIDNKNNDITYTGSKAYIHIYLYKYKISNI